MYVPKWIKDLFSPQEETVPFELVPAVANAGYVTRVVDRYGWVPLDSRFAVFSCGDYTEESVSEHLDPQSSINMRYSHGAPLILQRADSSTGPTVYEVANWLLTKERIVDTTTRVEIGSHETTFFDAAGYPIVRFYASGRKMHYSDGFRAYNARDLIRYYVGFEIDVNDIALPDVQHWYPPMNLQKGLGGVWLVTQGEPIRA